MIIILTTLYNAAEYVEKCIGSIMGQNHVDFKCYITDDISTDNSVNLVKSMIKGDDRFILIENTIKKYQPGNYDQVIRNNPDILDDDIIIEVDGDDWLPDSKTLSRIHEVYENTNVWITNGSFRYSNGALGFSSKQNLNNLRNNTFTASHMRTWKAFLWRKIKEEDLKDENGEYWSVAGDLAFMYPMLEMAGEEHYKFLETINYIYNEDNPLNDHKVNLNLVTKTINKIKNKQIYPKIKDMKRKIGLLVIATNKYVRFLDNLLQSADKHFLENEDVTYFVFTNNDDLTINCNRNVVKINIEHKPWPYMTLLRYEIFNDNNESLNDMDYLYYCDADMLFVGDFGGEIIGDRVATQHPGFCGGRGTPETRPNSLAYIAPHEQMQYFAGGFNGGSKLEFLNMCETISNNIKKDLENNIIAIWHDESHMNRYFINNPPTVILSPSYCYGELMNIPFQKKLISLDKDNVEIRS